MSVPETAVFTAAAKATDPLQYFKSFIRDSLHFQMSFNPESSSFPIIWLGQPEEIA